MTSVKDFDYSYPPDLIAFHPPQERGKSRMMVLDRANRSWEHRQFLELNQFLQKGDLFVLNNTKVFPCRLFAKKKTGGKVEVFLVSEIEPKIWECLVTDSKKIPSGSVLSFSDELTGELLDAGAEETRKLKLDYSGTLDDILQKIGHIPLPRYIKRKDEPDDHERYQTVFAQKSGAVAAPTAGLHFTEEMLLSLKVQGIEVAYVTLHVGLGTFLPIRTEVLEDHKMHREYYEIPLETVDQIRETKQKGNSVYAVGTTVVRALESAVMSPGKIQSGPQVTSKFIYPPYQFKVVDKLLTNFHQPQSSLLALVSAFAGREIVLRAYQEAIAKKYRLFSYGDCMLIQ